MRMSATSANVVEVTDATFAKDVLEESHRRPVVVDFWAEWCQPCRMIGPVLERLADEHGGDFLLAKLDTDSNPQASMAFRIQSIPAVKAFREGQLVSEFVGAIPEQAIRQWLEPLLPSEADRVVEQAELAEREGRLDDAERLFRQVLEGAPNHPGATLGAGRLAIERGDLAEARTLLESIRPDPEAERLLAAIDVSEWASPNGTGGPLAEAERAAAEGRFQEALETFLAAVRNGSEQDRQQAREAMLKVFSVLGEEDPLTAEYRRLLAAALY
jgi:putative thioredoxin